MNTEARLQDAFRKAFMQPQLLQPAVVKAVNVAEKTCEVELVASGTRVLRARLQAAVAGSDSHFFVHPAQDSRVLAAQFGEEWVVLLTEEVEELHLRGSSFGGLIKIAELTTKMNDAIAQLNTNISQIRSDLNASVSTFNSHTHTGNFSGTIGGAAASGALTVPTPASGASSPATITDAAALAKADYENTQVSHG